MNIIDNIINNYNEKDTICAIATPLKKSALSIIRVSGQNCRAIKFEIFKPNRYIQKPLVATRGILRSPFTEEIIDDIVCIFYNHGKSYTGEDLCEFHLHGSEIIIRNAMNLLINCGCRLAEPGEFTFRSFLNGKIDLSRSEYIFDLMEAKNQVIIKNAMKIVTGDLKNFLVDMQNLVVRTSSFLNVSIDFPEENIRILTNNRLIGSISNIINKITNILDTSIYFENAKEYHRALIVGEPNVGKSSLINTLIGYEKSIIHDIPGTTRDIIETDIVLNNINIKIIDTAGIRDVKYCSSNIEKMGILKCKNEIKFSDFVLILINQQKNVKIPQEIYDLIIQYKKPYCLIQTKSDLLPSEHIYDKNYIYTSSRTYKGIDKLKKLLIHKFTPKFKYHDESFFLTKKRHQESFKKIRHNFRKIKKLFSDSKGDEIISFYLKDIGSEINKITGQSVDKEILSSIFSKFCLGK